MARTERRRGSGKNLPVVLGRFVVGNQLTVVRSTLFGQARSHGLRRHTVPNRAGVIYLSANSLQERLRRQPELPYGGLEDLRDAALGQDAEDGSPGHRFRERIMCTGMAILRMAGTRQRTHDGSTVTSVRLMVPDPDGRLAAERQCINALLSPAGQDGCREQVTRDDGMAEIYLGSVSVRPDSDLGGMRRLLNSVLPQTLELHPLSVGRTY